MKFYISILLLFFTSFGAHGQNVNLNYSDLPLNEVLLDLSARYNIQVSINATTSGACKVTIDQSFGSTSEALEELAQLCGLDITMVGEVYSFKEKAETPNKKPKIIYYQYQGVVVDHKTLEPLPYAKIKIGNQGLIADENGRFNLRSKHPKEQLKIKYLGYFIRDSVVSAGKYIQMNLVAQNLQLPAVVIDTSKKVHRSQFGDISGMTRFNDVSKTLIPGANNNWMFNYMRLYPGIMAAGESVSDYIIWGSYSGQNHIIYDGITLFNSISVSNEIGRVNPSIIKSLDVYNGGYNVDVGDRTGGVLLINGKVGNKEKVTGSVNLNNQIANIYVDIPLFNKSSSLQLSARKSYQLFGLRKFKRLEENFVVPEFDFADLNVKFTTKFKNGDLLQFSNIASRDSYSASFEKKLSKDYASSLASGSDQIGSSLKYVHNTKKRGTTTLLFAYSNYSHYQVSKASFKDDISNPEEVFQNNDWSNSFSEFSAKINHNFNAFKRNTIQFSAAYIRNQYGFKVEQNLGSFTDKSNQLDRITGYVKDKIQVSTRFNIDLGMRIDIPITGQKPYLQPRINGLVKLSDRINMTFGSGKYYQFASRVALIDSVGMESSIWTISDGTDLPAQSAIHNVLGLSYSGNIIELGLNGYYKLMDGLARYYSDNSSDELSLGSAKAFGGDLFFKVRLKKHELWASYSIGQVNETYEYEGITNSTTAPQNQLHEIKMAGVFNFHPFYFSLASVIGSGIETSFGKSDFTQVEPYYRTDIAFQYKFKTKKLDFETGFSIVNVFNNRNVRISQFTSFPDGTIASTRGTHFTPSIFFNMNF